MNKFFIIFALIISFLLTKIFIFFIYSKYIKKKLNKKWRQKMNLKNWFNRTFRRRYLDMGVVSEFKKKGIKIFA